MNNFLFEVFEIRGVGNTTVIRGVRYSGTINPGNRIRFAIPSGGSDSIYPGISKIYVKSFESDEISDKIVIDIPYTRERYDAEKAHVWVIDADNNPCMVVNDNFDIKGRGVVIRGCVASGTIKKGDELIVITPDIDIKPVVIADIEQNRMLTDVCYEGSTVGLFIKGINNKNDIPIGSLLCTDLSDDDNTSILDTKIALIVNDTFDISGRGVVVTGQVLIDTIKKGDVLSYHLSNGVVREVNVIGIERERKLYNSVSRGDNVGLLLQGLRSKTEIPIGTHLEIIQSVGEQQSRNITRYALLIGNNNYGGNAQLCNCINDARAIGRKLRSFGFDLTIVENGNKEAIDKAINEFSKKAKDADVGFVFYSGHGMQCRGENYMIPIGATLCSPADVDYHCNRASYVLSKLEDANCNLKILVLDACRTNPFTRGWYRGECSEGLGVMGAPSGTIVAFATSPDSVALDGYGGANSPYTQGLLALLDRPELDIVTYFNKVSSYVYKLTNMQQNPWFSCSALTGDFYLAKK